MKPIWATVWVQLEGKDKSTHTLAPAIHIPIEDVTTLLSNNVGRELECDLEALVRAARESLREYLTTADVGISGANAIDAETGSIFLTENEGNIRCVTSMPRVHIAIAGIEKNCAPFNRWPNRCKSGGSLRRGAGYRHLCVGD